MLDEVTGALLSTARLLFAKELSGGEPLMRLVMRDPETWMFVLKPYGSTRDLYYTTGTSADRCLMQALKELSARIEARKTA